MSGLDESRAIPAETAASKTGVAPPSLRWRQVLLVLALAPALLAGVAASVVALNGRDSDPAFSLRQERPRPVERAEVERVVRTAPEPAGGEHGKPGVRASCQPRGRGELRNPWDCRVAYRSGGHARFRVIVRADSSYVGDHRGGTGTVEGCCISLSE